ncbi:hypothetical protein OA853_03375 [Prochlorococcus sp. AH-716-E17]|nr:hypothetical protein [Prochlorococcus sp. AH-716-E17]
MSINKYYEKNYFKSLDWILNSIKRKGGSAAYFLPFKGWSKSYPETTGYIIPTLLDATKITKDHKYKEIGFELGNWLLSIQDEEGFWRNSLYPYTKKSRSSIFNTGQILIGLLSLYDLTKNTKWIEASEKALIWLTKDFTEDKLWGGNDYLNKKSTPSYYAHVIWPMLELCHIINDHKKTALCEGAILKIIERKKNNNVFDEWGFKKNEPAFTHNIGYTIKGIQECGRILDNKKILNSVNSTLDKLIKVSELKSGKLDGLINDDFKEVGNFVCLTGNLQIAESLLIYESNNEDLRIVNSAAKLIDFVCSRQILKFPVKSIEGGIPGSAPFYGRYMRFRYPNWASKFFCDAILKLSERINKIA